MFAYNKIINTNWICGIPGFNFCGEFVAIPGKTYKFLIQWCIKKSIKILCSILFSFPYLVKLDIIWR